jgi:hypothetical protein
MSARRNATVPNRRKPEEPPENRGQPIAAEPRPGATAVFSKSPGTITAFPQAQAGALSNRALNVLKMLAAELLGECPPPENWTPSDALLRRVTFKHLSTARNCGPRTTREILQWAASRGLTIRPPSAGKSLSAAWKELGTRFAAGELTHAEIAEALEKSIRRKSTTIPVAVQTILLQLLNTSGKQTRT